MDEYILKNAITDIVSYLQKKDPSFSSLYVFCFDLDISKEKLHEILDFMMKVQMQNSPITFSIFHDEVQGILGRTLDDEVIKQFIDCIAKDGILPLFPFDKLSR